MRHHKKPYQNFKLLGMAIVTCACLSLVAYIMSLAFPLPTFFNAVIIGTQMLVIVFATIEVSMRLLTARQRRKTGRPTI